MASSGLLGQRSLGVNQAQGRARSGCNTIIVTCEKSIQLGGLPRTRRNLNGRDELV